MNVKVNSAPDPLVFRVEEVSKRFTLRKDKSLKERLSSWRESNKHREEFLALNQVSFTVSAGTTIALIGHNGSGKSTLLKILGGIIDPSSGVVYRRGRIAALLELGAGFHPDLSGRDNVFLNASLLGLSHKETELVFQDIVDFAEINDFIDTPVKFYSSGMYVRLAFAVAVHVDPEILLVDEVLAVGDEAFQRKCLNVIQSFQEQGRTIVLVTHDLGQVERLADSAILLDQGKIVFNGDPVEAVSKFRELLEQHRIERELTHGVTGIEQKNLDSISNEFDDEKKPDGPSIKVECQVASTAEHVRNLITVKAKISNAPTNVNWECTTTIYDSNINSKAQASFSHQSPLNSSETPDLSLSFTFEDLILGPGTHSVVVSFFGSEQDLLAESQSSFQITSFSSSSKKTLCPTTSIQATWE